MSKDDLGNKYVQMISEAKSELKAPGTTNKEGFDKGTAKAKEFTKDSGPESAEGVDNAVEAPEELNPLKKKGLTKESTNMDKPSFMDLFDQVMSEDVGVEDPSYDEASGDFPPAADDELGMEDEMGDEPVTVTLTSDQVSVLKDILAQLEGEEGLEGDMEMGGEMDLAGDEDTMGEAVSEPEPKELNANTAQLQLPNKLGRDGVKVSPKKGAALSAGAKKRTGEIEQAPKGFTPGNKGMMKVSGSGSSNKANNSSLVEDN